MPRTRMRGFLSLLLAGAVLVPGAALLAASDRQAPETSKFNRQLFWQTTKVYCETCHFGPRARADLNLQSMDLAHLETHGGDWEKVLRKLRNREMPPSGYPRPAPATYQALIATIEAERDRVSLAEPDPGRPALHRLNRTEYANAIRDLLAVEMDVSELLPADDAGYGFDNIGDTLSVSPLLIEGYLDAARKISRRAVGDANAGPVVTNYDLPRSLIQTERMSEDLPLGSRGGMAVRHDFPADGEYTLRIKLQKNGYTYMLGTEHERQIDVRVDGEAVKRFVVGGDYKGRRPAQPSSFGQGEYERYLMNADQNLEFRFPAKAGSHLVQVTFQNYSTEPEGVYQPPITDYSYALSYGRSDMEPAVAGVSIGGPYNTKSVGNTESRARIFICKPKSESEEDACAGRILGNLARHAFRRPVGPDDLQELMEFYQSGRADGASFEDGIVAGVQRILADPEFLFRVEHDPKDAKPGSIYRISDLELASRLSFFLWSSLPDEELLKLAEAGKLSDSATLEKEIARMLADSRAEALTKNFAGQWLYLRNLEKIWPNPDAFPEFDANLRDAFKMESELFFESLLKENKSVVDLITADYTFVNERLARHYGIPGIYGSHFRRVALTDDNRKGFLGQGSILTVTSFATRTAPTVRGKWLLENILGTPPPPPPPNVTSLASREGSEGKQMSMRQQMEAHRSNPACASCHKFMDPLGFALENFDATGKWRDTDSGVAIDASGVTPDGFAIGGPADLRKYLAEHPDQFVTTVTEKLLTYALGRGVEEYDYPLIRRIVRELKPGNYKWADLIVAIAKSAPFQMRKAREI